MTPPDPPQVRGDVSPGVSDARGESDPPDDLVDDEPNYLIRRGIAVAGVVAAIAAGAIFVGGLVGGGDDTGTSGAADAEWNTIVLLDERSGQVIALDPSGEEAARFASGVTKPTDALAVGPTMLATSADAATVVNLADESAQTVELDIGTNGVTMPAGTALTMLASTATGDRAVLAHGPTGEVLDTATFAPITGARYDTATAMATPGGGDVLVTDSGNFQSVLFSFEREEASYFPGRALAIGDDLVVTTQNVGSEASITVFDHDGASVSDARTPSVRAAMISGGSVILVTVDGEILELASTKGTTTSIDTLDIGTVETGYVSPTGDRLIVVGDAGTAIVDGSGDVLGTFSDARPLDAGIDELAPRTSICVGLTAGDSSLLIAGLDDGSVVAEAEVNPPLLSTVDGCTVVASAPSGLSIVDQDGVASRPADGDLVAVAPDGHGAVTASDAGRLLFTDLTAPAGTSTTSLATSTTTSTTTGTIDLGPASRLVLFTRR